MTNNNHSNNDKAPSPNSEAIAQTDHADDNADDDRPSIENVATQQALTALTSLQQQNSLTQANTAFKPPSLRTANPRASLLTLVAVGIVLLGLVLNNSFLGLLGTLFALLLSVAILFPLVKRQQQNYFHRKSAPFLLPAWD